MEGTAFILVRSVVANPDDRKAFEHWYQTDHIPLVFSKIENVNQIWRFWSKSDPAVHYSLSEFPNMSEFQRAASSEGFKYIVADYDRAWGTRVTRTRDILEKVQHFSR
jgi:hypothetical protein